MAQILIISGFDLGFGTGKHALNAQTDGRNTHGGTPGVIEDGKTDESIGVDVFVGGGVAQKNNFGGFDRLEKLVGDGVRSRKGR